MSFYDDIDLKYTETIILMTTCNKFNPGIQTFYLQSLVPADSKSNKIVSEINDGSNILNKDKSGLGISKVSTCNTIQLELPREIARQYPKKWIPPGTRFLMSFNGGDITKPKIVGRDF